MRYRDLNIETRRDSPSRARTAGAALLIRAGYLTAENRPTELGSRAILRLGMLAASSKDLFDAIQLPVIRTSGQDIYVESVQGGTAILRCGSCGYADALELANSRKNAASSEPLRPIRRIATPNCSTIQALVEFLAIPRDRTAKALMYSRISDGQFVFVVMRGDTQISPRKLDALLGPVRMATPEEIAQAGAAAGYASPIGLNSGFVVVDELIPGSPNLVTGANESGFHFENTNCGRDYHPQLIADLALAAEGDACPNCGAPLRATSGFLVADGDGYRFQEILLAAAEAHHDDRGLTLPPAAAPFDVYVIRLPSKELDTCAPSEDLVRALENDGVAVLYDDRDQRAGVKFSDADLIGCPVRLTVSERNLRNGMVELKYRTEDDIHLLRPADAVAAIQSPPGLAHDQ